MEQRRQVRRLRHLDELTSELPERMARPEPWKKLCLVRVQTLRSW